MSKKIWYFGYGANKMPEMMGAILGKNPDTLQGTPVTLPGYKLGVQKFDQIPDTLAPGSHLPVSVRKIIAGSWKEPEKFETYVIKPGEGEVQGTVWELTMEERDLVREWELVGDWYKEVNVEATTKDGQIVKVQTEILGDGQEIDHEVDERDYQPFLNDLEEFRRVAEKSRQEYFERTGKLTSEGSATSPEKT